MAQPKFNPATHTHTLSRATDTNDTLVDDRVPRRNEFILISANGKNGPNIRKQSSHYTIPTVSQSHSVRIRPIFFLYILLMFK